MPPISVIIPCFNHAYVLRRTFEGLATQTVKPQEVIVVDDGSVDQPAAIIFSFSNRLPLSFIRLEKNCGAPRARNLGAAQSHGEYLLFLDADAELVPDALETFARALTEHPDAAFAYSNFFWGAKRFRGRPFDAEELRRRNFIHTSSLIRREAFPGFDETLHKFQDWDLWLTMAERGSKGTWIDRELYRIEPRRQGMSKWLPRIAYVIPWQRLGFVPKEIANYREAERVVRQKHRIV
ncbi:glycosyltransferase family 2 protein [Candidatus Uhrbacteria bacterium]|nr:glycosyltransferase family 2 protein [Candidatus Uhrbacteria bacterium]